MSKKTCGTKRTKIEQKLQDTENVLVNEMVRCKLTLLICR